MKCKCYIGNAWTSPDNPEIVNKFNPANLSEKICEVEYADPGIAGLAVEKAESALDFWKIMPPGKRAELLRKYITEIRVNENELAEIITRENGKTLKESFNEIDAGLDEAHYQIDFLLNSLIEKTGKFETRYEPLGVVLLITPWNFPVATVLRKMIPALMTGNTVVLKPSELSCMTSVTLFKLFEKFPFPTGVVNLVLGGGDVGSALTNISKIKAVSVTGSTQTGAIIKKQISKFDTRLQAEMGGKNCVVVLPDADIEKAASDIVSNSFACAGQWCTGTSKVIAHKEIIDELLEHIVSSTKEIKLGNGMNEITKMGPLVSEIQLMKVKSAVQKSQSAKLVVGGKQPQDEKLLNGYFFEPTIFADVDPDSFLSQEEIFGPVLSVIKSNEIDDMLKTANNSKYGLSFSVYTYDDELAEKFIDKVDAGLCHINLPTAYRDPALPLLGWKNSGYGLPESGRYTLDFFTRTKAVYRNLK